MNSGAVELLYRALEARVGIAIRTSDPTRMRARLYEARKTNPDFEALSIKPSHSLPQSELWIVRKTPLSKDSFDGSES
jgi:hypothetical protein